MLYGRKIFLAAFSSSAEGIGIFETIGKRSGLGAPVFEANVMPAWMTCTYEQGSRLYEHENGKDDEIQSCQRCLQAFIIASQTAETTGPGKATLYHPTLGQQDETLLGFGKFDYFQANSLLLSCLSGFFARVALIDISQLDSLPDRFLYRPGQLIDLCSLLLIGWRDQSGQQMPQRIDGKMDFTAPLAFVTVVTGPATACDGALQGAAVKNGGAGFWIAVLGLSEQVSEVFYDARRYRKGGF